MRTFCLLPIGCLLAALASGCGGGSGGGGVPPGSSGPNQGNGHLSIVNPTSGNYQTDRPTVTLSGNAFIPAGAGCTVPPTPFPAGYQVTWSNNSTGSAGNGARGLNCFLFVFVFWDAVNIPLAMGANSITVTASDGAGNVGRDTIVVTRIPDSTPPSVNTVSPANGSTGVGINAIASVSFSEEMDPLTINTATFTLRDGANPPVPATVTYNSSSRSVTLRPTSLLAFNTTYQATVTTGVRDAAGGNALADPYTFSFTTGPNPDTTPPSVVSVTPADGSICASTTDTVTATFSESLDPSTVNGGTFMVIGAGNQAIPGTVSYIGNQTAAFAPDAPLNGAASFMATLTTGIKDLAGNALASPFAWNFTTLASQGVGTWASTSFSNAPYARSGHVAVWTGSEMVVAGGLAWNSDFSVFEYTSQSGRYSPATGTWVLANGAPAASNQKAVWTGSRMLVWGGHDSGTAVTRGAAFDPVANTWGQISTTSQPAARFDHTAVWTGSEMIVWGGRNNFSNQLVFGNGARYNPASATWVPISTNGAPSARFGHTAVWTGSEMIVWGGQGATGALLRDGARYNPSTDSWTPVTSSGAPSERVGHVAVWTGTEMIVWGSMFGSTKSGGLYDPATNSWRATESLCAPSGRWKAPAIWTGTRMIIWGGTTVSSYFANGAAYDPVGNVWAQLADAGAPTARADHSAVWTGTAVIMWGGTDGGPSNSGGTFTP
jgi:hypothetical protein